MTAQEPDRLIHRGKEYALFGSPLEDLAKWRRRKRRLEITYKSTSNWRGYVATWEIIDRRLYLTAIEDNWCKIGDKYVELSLEVAFPKGPHPLPADWVDDLIRCPEGRMRQYVHQGFASVFERDRLFSIHGGRLYDEWLVYNPPCPLFYLIGENGERTYADAMGKEALLPDQDPFPGDTPVEPWRAWGNPDWDICQWYRPDE